MKKIFVMLLLLVLTVNVIGCSGKEQTENQSYDISIYTFDSETYNLKTFGYRFDSDVAKDKINTVFSLLKNPGNGSEGIFNDMVYVDNWVLSEDGILQITFGERYYEQESTREVMTRGAIVKTLCQLPEIDGVMFYVLLSDSVDTVKTELYINGAAVGIQTDADYIEDIGYSHETLDLILYFGNEAGDRLVPTVVSVESNDNYTIEQQIVLALISEAVPDGLRRTVPEHTKINRIVTRNYVCYIDFSSDFLNLLDSVTSEVTVYSIVNSLAVLDITQVVFTVDGASVDVYGDLDLTQMFEFNQDICEEEETVTE